MIFLRYIVPIIIISCSSIKCLGQYVVVDDTFTAQQLVENVLINSPCANVSNFSVSGDPFNPGEQSYGYFNGGSSGFPFLEGIVLSTSRAKRTQGPNDNLIDEGLNTWLGDSDLETALNITDTYNATILEFDFTPLTSHISFDYIFASEEYQGNAPCQYSDGFAFLLKPFGSPSPYQNLALIPNTNIPVLVTSVRPDIPGSCTARNERYFGGYNSSTAPINFNGQTVVMTAQATVIPGTVYHIKLVIADHENVRYDSAIYLGGGSFNVGTDLGPDRLIANNNPVCQGESYVLDATEAGINTYRWFKNNVLIPDAVTATYNVFSGGIYRAEITLGATTCIATGEATVEYSPLPALTDTTIVQCDEDHNGYSLFNLTVVDNIIRNGDNSLGAVTYYETLLAAQNQDSSLKIDNPVGYTSGPQTVYASVTNTFGCSNVASVVLQLSNNTVPGQQSYESCDLDLNMDGFYGFPFNELDAFILTGLPPGLVVEYFPSLTDALLQTNILSNPYTNTIRYQTLIFARIINGPNCYGIIPVRLYVNSNQPPNFGDENVFLCENGALTLAVTSTFNAYAWSNGGTAYQTEVTAAGEYTVTVTDENGCEATKKFNVIISTAPQITNVQVDDFNEDGSTIIVEYLGLGNYEFSINGSTFQDSPYFADVPPGNYTVTVRDKNGCGEDFRNVKVLNYPKYFTPNGDGYNDIWTIENLTMSSDTKIDIFDRLGKLVCQINPSQKYWDGKLNSKDLPSTDYWFVLHMPNKTVKGHFALKR